MGHSHKLVAVLVSVVCLGYVRLATAQNITKLVDLGYAAYQSNYSFETDVTSFLGIRYAAPPLGDLRWQAPQPPANVSGVQNATTEPAECIQGSQGLDPSDPFRTSTTGVGNEKRTLVKRATTQSEDCLFLNVHIPSNISSDASLPVVVWIHGGGYASGSATDWAQDFVRESGYNVVSVNMQYRLGLFGFLPGMEVKEGGALNAGLLDQQFALQWVQEYIAAFGGDPTRVTIWGESAGAGSVLQHVVAHGGNTQPPLFRGVMTSSTFLPFQYNFNDTIPETLYSEVVSQSNCSNTTDSLACLRAADVATLTAANLAVAEDNFYGTWAFVPVVDGEFIVERPSVTLNKTQLNGEALLAVTNTLEGVNFVNTTAISNTNQSLATYVSLLFPRMTNNEIEQAVAVYASVSNITGLREVENQAALVMGENIFICPTYYLLRGFGATKDAWKGQFAIPPAYHGGDLPYYFATDTTRPTFNSTAFFQAFSDSFLSLAINLNASQHIDPTDIKPIWDTWNGAHAEMLFNQTVTNLTDVHTFETDTALLERCEFWESLGAVNAQ